MARYSNYKPNNGVPHPPCLTIEEFSRLVGASYEVVCKCFRSRDLTVPRPRIKAGRHPRYAKDELLAWWRAREVKAK